MVKSNLFTCIICIIIGMMYSLPTECSNRILINAGGDKNLATSDSRSVFRNWHKVMTFPTSSEVEEYNKSSIARSPYIQAWLDTQNEGPFTQFSIDFKADYLPTGTYCSLFNYYIDYSSLLKKYERVYTDASISGYGGLQRQPDGTKYNSILSLWDTYCETASGEKDTIRAKLIQPLGAKEINYDHEGNGVSFRPPYPWKSRKWYRMLIKLGKSKTTGNTTLEQWICDLSEKTWKQLCKFDLGAQDLKFKNKIAVFLENFQPKAAGEIRTMEFKNIRIFSSKKQSWVNIYSGNFSNDVRPNPKKSGSYQYGADDDTFWMITTGVPNCAVPQEPASLKVSKSDTGDPLDLYDSTVEIDNSAAGNIEPNLPEWAYHTPSLKVSGEINGTDMVTLRKLTGRDENKKVTDGIATSLDLSDAKFIPGGNIYCEDYTVTSSDEVPNHGFYWSNLEKVILPKSINTIGKNAFEMCNKLTDVSIGNNIKRIEFCAFNVCSSLKKIELPSSVEFVASYAFWNDDNLDSVIVHASQPPTAYEKSFSNACYSKAKLIVPNGTKEAYSSAEGWKEFANIIESTSTDISAITVNTTKTQNIYNIQGQLVRKGSDGKSSLSPGVYIINNKKVIISVY